MFAWHHMRAVFEASHVSDNFRKCKGQMKTIDSGNIAL